MFHTTHTFHTLRRTSFITNTPHYVRRRSVACALFIICILSLAAITTFAQFAQSTTTLVSLNSAWTASGNNQSNYASISADGRYVAFASRATNLVATSDTNNGEDIFVRDLQTNTTTLVSVNSAGTASGNNFSTEPSISADGRFVAFSSVATDLIADDTMAGQVFVRDLQTNTTTLVSVNGAGTASGNNFSTEPSISADGRFVAFRSSATDLVTTSDTNNREDVFVRDLQTNVTTLVSVNSAGTASGNDVSLRPSISADGRYVAFGSEASNLTADTDTNSDYDIFVRDLQANTTTLVSVNSAGTASGNNASFEPSISADGRFVAFFSSAADLIANDTISDQVFLRDLQTNTTTVISRNNDGISSNNGSFTPSINANGNVIAFESFATNLDARDTNFTGDIYVRRLPVAPAQIQFDSATYTVAENGGSAIITVTRSGNLSASVSVKYKTSNGTAVAGSDYTSVASTLVFAANETTRTFTVNIINNSTSEQSETVNLTLLSPTTGATLGTRSTAVLTITDDDPPSITIRALTLTPTTVNGGTFSIGKVTLNVAAPAGGAEVALASSHAAASVPPKVTVPGGATSTTFTINTNAVAADTLAGITASRGTSSLTAKLTIKAPVLTALRLNPTSVTGGAASIGTVELSGAAPSGGTLVALSSNVPAAASVPANVTVAAGATSANFTVTTTPLAANKTVTITAKNGTVSKTAGLMVNTATVSTLTLNPTSVKGGEQVTGKVTLTGAAPTGGAIVTLRSSSAAVAAVPASVTVAAGASTATFTVTSKPVTVNKSVTITATRGAAKSAVLIVTP